MRALPFVIMLIAAIVGYREADGFRKSHGQAPWGVPPLVWAAIAGVSLLIGAVLLAVAKRTTQRRAVPATPQSWSSHI